MIFRSEKMRPLLALVYVVGWAMAFPLIKLGYAEMGIESAGDLGNKILFAGVRFLAAGLLLILLVSFVLGEAGMQGADVALQAVLDIAVIAFCVQALSSFARRLQQAGKSVGMQRGMIAVLAVLAWFGASLYLAIYGCASALFGSRGALKQYSKKNQDK